MSAGAQEEELEASDDASDFLSGLATASFVESLLQDSSESSDEEARETTTKHAVHEAQSGTSPPFESVVEPETGVESALLSNDEKETRAFGTLPAEHQNVMVQVTPCTIETKPYFVATLAGIAAAHGWKLKAAKNKTERPSHSRWYENATVVFKLGTGRDRLDRLNKVDQLRPDQWLSTCIGLGPCCAKDTFELYARREGCFAQISTGDGANPVGAARSPRTLVLPVEEGALDRLSEDIHYIIKPAAGSQGSKIQLISGRSSLLRWWANYKMLEEDPDARRWVVQEYVANPMTLFPEGRKFDLRLYLVAVLPAGAPSESLCGYLFSDGMLRLCSGTYTQPGDIDHGTDDWRYAHLTNTSLNGTESVSDRANTDCTESLRSSSALRAALEQIGTDLESVWESLAAMATSTLATLRRGLVESLADEESDASKWSAGAKCGMFQIRAQIVMLAV